MIHALFKDSLYTWAKKNTEWFKYFGWYFLGVAVAMLSPKEQLIRALEILGPITLTALFASLQVPFAGISDGERIQRFAMKYAIVPLFGLYTVLLWYQASFGGIVLFVMAAAVHVSYWTQSYHSRQYRLEQWKLSFGQLNHLAQVIGMLNGTNKNHLADEMVVRPMFEGKEINFEQVEQCLPEEECLIERARVQYDELFAADTNF